MTEPSQALVHVETDVEVLPSRRPKAGPRFDDQSGTWSFVLDAGPGFNAKGEWKDRRQVRRRGFETEEDARQAFDALTGADGNRRVVVDRSQFTEMTLDQLAEALRSQNTLVASTGRTLLRQAIIAGEILLEARSRVTPGKWIAWLETVGIHRRQAARYMELARDQDILPDLDTMGITQAAHYLQDLRRHRGHWNRMPDEIREHARALHREGTAVSVIARTIGYSEDAVRCAIDPKYARKRTSRGRVRRRRRAEDRRIIEQQRKRDAASARARATGGLVEKAWNAYLAFAKDLDTALAQATPEQRRHLADARGFAHKAEDAISEAMRDARMDNA